MSSNFGDLKLNLKGNELSIRKTELEGKSILKKLTGVYDEHAKLLFLFDVSGSMNSRIARSYTDQYTWTDDIIAAVRQRTQSVVFKANQLRQDPLLALMGGGLDPDEQTILNMADTARDADGNFVYNPKDDEDVKERVVRYDALGLFGVAVDFAKHTEVPPTRLDLVKKLAKQEIANRFNKFPKSRVSVTVFGSWPTTIFDDGEPEKLWPELEKIQVGNGGSTELLAGVKELMNVARNKPSSVGLHHFIIISDGEAHTAPLIDWIPTFKASGVVVDYIHIGDSSGNYDLQEVCKQTGGSYVVVNSERDFKEKFVDAVNRPMLPAAV